ncbi:MAG: hypothetical protein QM594_06080 [Niabella sp.]
MKTQFLYIIIFFFSIVVTSCKKGDTGSAGPQGPQGQIGATGADGTKIYSGHGAPESTLGRNGDFYLDLIASNMYGPKTDAGWGTPLSLKGISGTNGTNGTNGANGTNGSKIYSGTGAPGNNIGVPGDYFMSTNTYFFYGPKTDTGWGAALNLRGPQGPAGPGAATRIFSSQEINWSTIAEYGVQYKAGQIALPELTNDIVNNGAVLVYGAFNFGTSSWTGLPITYLGELPPNNNEVKLTYNLFFTYQTGSVQLRFSRSDNSVPGNPVIRFKVVLIPGTALNMAKKNGVDLKNYEAVKAAFRLQ